MKVKCGKLKTEWHRWFAWHPVSVGDSCRWLEVVERKGSERTVLGPDWEPELVWNWEYRAD